MSSHYFLNFGSNFVALSFANACKYVYFNKRTTWNTFCTIFDSKTNDQIFIIVWLIFLIR